MQKLCCWCLPLLVLFGLPAHAAFTRLEPLAAPHVSDAAKPYPGGRYQPHNLVDGNPQTEYSSDGLGTNTFVEFDFGHPVSIAAFAHLDRDDPATVAASELTFLDAAGSTNSAVAVQHVNQRGGTTFFALPAPITAQRVRWQVTQLGAGLATVGGAEITFYTPGSTDATPTATRIEGHSVPLLEHDGLGLRQVLEVSVDFPYSETTEAVVRVGAEASKTVELKPGKQTLEFKLVPIDATKTLPVALEVAGKTVLSQTVQLDPVRKLIIYLLPHSHNDIGYTALQADVVKKQNSNIETGLRLARETADYPEGARFVWNTEVLWCVDNYLRQASPEQHAQFIAAVKAGQLGLDAFYCNILTGLCRPEELLNLMRYATRLSAETGVPITSAMISDVPGYTWSTVSAMAQAGVKYFSFAPNYFDRMGATMKDWQNRPFWWVGPDGHTRILAWCPSRGYALGHLIGDGENLARFIPTYLHELQTNNYPYDITYLRWNVHGDNGSPDEKLSNVVRDWNARYAYPRLIISRTATAFAEFERRYSDQLPVFAGDYTPYWEDGAASSATETALNRASAERLTQAETLWVMRNPSAFPAEAFQDAWRNVLLYSEHTWGAHNSISEPDLPFVREQWKVKQSYAVDADKQSRELLAQAVAAAPNSPAPPNGSLDVFNTQGWTRTDLVTLDPSFAALGDSVQDDKGKAVPSQRLMTGELVFLARNVPPFTAKRFRITPGPCPTRGAALAKGNTLSSKDFTLEIDEQTGAIKSLVSRALNRELVDAKAPTALNDYFYLPGSDLKGLERNGKPTIHIKENGPLVASLLIESTAPGCRSLRREVRLVDGLARVEIINTVDKLPIRAKEGLHLGYAFAVPEGQVRLDLGWAMVRPDIDQIPASCKNWFTVQRWVDISNDKFGVTWAPVDAPLVEVGGITANLIGSQTHWQVWRDHVGPTQTLYSWIMNNHWHTNYRADQEGPTVFRYYIQAHKAFEPEAATRFGTDCSEPLIVARASSTRPAPPRLKLSTDRVVVAGLKPTDDGLGWLVRLFGASGQAEQVRLAWSAPVPHQVWLSDTSEQPHAPAGKSIPVPAWGIVTLRAE
jgi:alpha-mannosidase